jgi:preprotein translocase subunit SecB
MAATISPLELESYYLKEISYSVKDNLLTKPEKINEIKDVGLDIGDITTASETASNQWRCELTIQSSDSGTKENLFYSFKIIMVGFFKVSTNLTADLASKIAKANCPAVLYSASREIVATVTRRSPYPAIILPLVTFIEIGDEQKAKKSSSKKK